MNHYKPRGNALRIWEYIQTRPNETLSPTSVGAGMGVPSHNVAHPLLMLSGHMPKFERLARGRYMYTGLKREPKSVLPVEAPPISEDELAGAVQRLIVRVDALLDALT